MSRCDVRLVCGDDSDLITPGRKVQVFINGMKIPHVVDAFASFPLDGAAMVCMSFRPSRVKVDGISPKLVMRMLKESCNVKDESESAHVRSLGDGIRHGEISRDLQVLFGQLHANDLAKLRSDVRGLLTTRAAGHPSSDVTDSDDGGNRSYEPSPTSNCKGT